MSNDDIALNFDTAKYYSLHEACDYLNRKHKTDNITPTKLLKKALEYKVRLFVYGQGFSVDGDYVLESFLSRDNKGFLNMNEAEKVEWREYSRKVNRVIDDMLSVLINDRGAFFQIKNEAIETLPLVHKINTEVFGEGGLFEGLLPIDDLKANSNNLEFINPYLLNQFNDSVGFTLAHYPKIEVYYDTEEELDAALTEAIGKCSLKIIDYYCQHKEDNKLLIIEPYFEITLDDLIILDDDLVKLEQLIQGKGITEDNQTNFSSITLGRKGLSKNKALAQHIARHIAEKEWQSDKAQEIRMSDMTNNVWAKLHKLGFSDELPDQAKSLKPWIKDIAPHYASEGGRPSSN
ncbi:hypothetical protein R0J89_01105 [Psychrobacter sp. SIMBA_152]